MKKKQISICISLLAILSSNVSMAQVNIDPRYVQAQAAYAQFQAQAQYRIMLAQQHMAQQHQQAIQVNNNFYRSMEVPVIISNNSTSLATQESVWKWSETLQGYYYRDNDGRVHYGDGSISGPSTAWSEGGKTVYSANSVGPADKTGQYAIQRAPIDETAVGPAPVGPPAGYVIAGPNTGPVFGGTNPNSVRYIAPIKVKN